ncbi:hypothetical protein DIPPA_70142 [Diplonema papillatum]|nr:hypothetical protein DIPPA_70142 [Diplonema papillatum]
MVGMKKVMGLVPRTAPRWVIQHPMMPLMPYAALAGSNGLRRTAPLLKDKAFGQREFKVRKQQKIELDEDEEDEDEVIARLVAESEQLDDRLESILEKFQLQTKAIVSLSKGGTAGLETVLVEGKPITSLASISTAGIEATVNVYHTQNVTKVKKAIEEQDQAMQPKAGLTPTSLKLILPKMTGEKRAKLVGQVKETAIHSRNAGYEELKQLQADTKKDLLKIDNSKMRQFEDDIRETRHSFSEKINEIVESARIAILGEKADDRRNPVQRQANNAW